MTVSGLIRTNAERQSFHNCESQTHRTRSAHLRRSLCPRLERCRTKSWCRRAEISARRTARARKQSRREKSRVSKAWEGYRSRLCKCNDFNVYGLFGRDSYLRNQAAADATQCKPLTRLNSGRNSFSVLAAVSPASVKVPRSDASPTVL